MKPTTPPTMGPSQNEVPAPAVVPARIVSTPGTCGGRARIDGHRITVADIVIRHDRMGQSPGEIISGHPSITTADVLVALAYYREHREQIDADIREGEQLIAEMKQVTPSLLLAPADGSPR